MGGHMGHECANLEASALVLETQAVEPETFGPATRWAITAALSALVVLAVATIKMCYPLLNHLSHFLR